MNKDTNQESVTGGGQMERVVISIGALEPTITKQLKGRAPAVTLRLMDEHSKRITWLHLHGLLTDAESDGARRRLMRRIQDAVNLSRVMTHKKGRS